MTNKTINGVPRALLQRWLDNEDFFNNLQGQSMSAIDAARKEGDKILDELRALLNAPDPIVEADGIGVPVAVLLIDEYFDNREIGDVDVQLDKEVCERLATDYPGQSIDLYSADQLVALQSTIAHLRQHKNDYMEAAEETRKALTAEIAQLKAENERLRGVHDGWKLVPVEPTEHMMRVARGLTLQQEQTPSAEYRAMVNAAPACLDEVRRMNP